MSEDDKAIGVGSDGIEARGVAALPDWFPAWAGKLAELYFSGTTNTFVVHGNTFDFVRVGGADDRPRYGTLAEFLAEQLFGRWELVLHYDLAGGLRCLAGRKSERLKEMVALANRRVGDLAELPKDPTKTLAVLDRFVARNIMAADADRVSAAIILDHAGFLVPRGDRVNAATSRHLVTLLNWAASPYVKRLNMAFVLIGQGRGEISERLTSNPHVATVDVALPTEEERSRFLAAAIGDRDTASFSDYSSPEIAKLTAGISLTDVNVLVKASIEGGRRLDRAWFQGLKKRLIERQAQGLLEFIEPRWGLDMVVGHEAAKRRLRDDAELLKRGALDTVPMGYLFCGPVGTGKSFLAQCATGAIGIPCVKLKNFRSKYVGETEGNLERVLTVLRSMGPVVVVVDEADAMLGDREQGGDSGVGSRVFGMIASQMGDTRYRGRLVWMLLTARPDLLPIDIKRQGRAEVHVPLFYPAVAEELKQMFLVLARKVGATLSPEDVPEVPHKGNLSGADIEGIISRAWRASLLAGESCITREILADVLAGFMPSTQSLEREMQEIAAIIECTDREFLPDHIVKKMEQLGGRAKLQERFTAIRQIVEAS